MKTQPFLELAIFLNINNNLRFERISQETVKSIDFNNLQYSGCSLSQMTFKDVIFDSCEFYGTSFSEVEFKNCLFINCKFHFSHMNNCILTSCHFECSEVMCSTFKNLKVHHSSIDHQLLDYFQELMTNLTLDQLMAA
jgi:uncharacterized protein YjbI with pentapeptide repeats